MDTSNKKSLIVGIRKIHLDGPFDNNVFKPGLMDKLWLAEFTMKRLLLL